MNISNSIIDYANFCVCLLKMNTYLKDINDVNPAFLISLYCNLFDLNSYSLSPRDYFQNISAIIKTLSSVLDENLEYISVKKIISNEKVSIFHILEIISALVAFKCLSNGKPSDGDPYTGVNDNSSIANIHGSPEIPRSSSRIFKNEVLNTTTNGTQVSNTALLKNYVAFENQYLNVSPVTTPRNDIVIEIDPMPQSNSLKSASSLNNRATYLTDSGLQSAFTCTNLPPTLQLHKSDDGEVTPYGRNIKTFANSSVESLNTLTNKFERANANSYQKKMRSNSHLGSSRTTPPLSCSSFETDTAILDAYDTDNLSPSSQSIYSLNSLSTISNHSSFELRPQKANKNQLIQNFRQNIAVVHNDALAVQNLASTAALAIKREKQKVEEAYKCLLYLQSVISSTVEKMDCEDKNLHYFNPKQPFYQFANSEHNSCAYFENKLKLLDESYALFLEKKTQCIVEGLNIYLKSVALNET